MKPSAAILSAALWLIGNLHGFAQGYIVPNGVTYAGYSSLFGGYEIDVLHDPANSYYTGFSLNPKSKTPPTVYTNTFAFDGYVDVGIRVFLVSPNTPISLQPILSQSFTELLFQNTYVFTNGIPFYLGLFTGTGNFHPPDGIYTDPLFGWVQLVNNQGVIQMIGGAIEYGGGGIYAGTQNIIPVPEPSALALPAIGTLLLGCRRWKNAAR